MALTMTRNRTQTTLTKLATRLANVHGELAYVEERLTTDVRLELRQGLARRRDELLAIRDALYATLRQYDAALDPTVVGVADEWLKPFGRGLAARKRYEASTARLSLAEPGSPGG